MGLLRDVMCCMSPLIVLEVTGQLLSWFGLICRVLVEVFFYYYYFQQKLVRFERLFSDRKQSK